MNKKILFSIFIFSIALCALDHVLGAIFEQLDIIKNLKGPKFKNLTQEIFLAIFFAPLGETFIFQVVVYYLISLFESFLTKYFNIIYLITSALLFALSHSYSIYYQIGVFLPGVLLAYAFLYFKNRSKYPILCVTIVHALHNIYILVLETFDI
ncbi:CPBP family intramembrane glutamic endopeptidase [Elizabethkingia anophelis]|uniref:CPBP family intramembrane glutamic endopeptidase n=1 Tax=Elizabethkingia anophelis TaxID=1117645 RepID=UPI00320B47BC